MDYVLPKHAAEHYGVSKQTLVRWANSGKIRFLTTQGGHRRYAIVRNDSRKKYIYARVSSHKQRKDLKKQIKFLEQHRPEHELISDIGSGINFNRKGFKTILDELLDGNVSEVVVSHKDRFTRFGFELIEWLFTKMGAKIIVLCKTKEQEPEQELSEDLLSLITVFTARYHGSRKYKLNKKDKDLSERVSEEAVL